MGSTNFLCAINIVLCNGGTVALFHRATFQRNVILKQKLIQNLSVNIEHFCVKLMFYFYYYYFVIMYITHYILS